MSLRDLGIALFVTMVWGLNFPIGKHAVTELPPVFMLAMRFALVGLLLVFVVPVPFGRLRRLYGLSLTLGVLHFATMFTGLSLVDASTAAVCQQLQVPFAALLGILVHGDRPGWKGLVGMVVAFAGVAVIAGEPRLFDNLPGLVLVIAAALLWAVSAVQTKGLGDVSPMQTNAWMAIFAAPQLLLVSLVLERDQIGALQRADWLAFAVVVYMAVLVTILGYGLWYSLVRRYPVSTVMPFTLLVPIFGVFFGALFLNDPLTPQFLVGGALTVAGVGLMVLRRPAAEGA